MPVRRHNKTLIPPKYFAVSNKFDTFAHVKPNVQKTKKGRNWQNVNIKNKA